MGTEQNEKAEFRKEWNKETIINQTYFLWKVFPERTSEEMCIRDRLRSDKLFTHHVTVRRADDEDGFLYVSNTLEPGGQVLPYTPRTAAEMCIRDRPGTPADRSAGFIQCMA